MDAAERLSILREYTRLSLNGIASRIGTSPQNLYDIKNGRHGFSRGLADLICEEFQNINKAWLITGEGNITRENEVFPEAEANVENGKEPNFIPVLPFSAAAGWMNGGNGADAFQGEQIAFTDFSDRGADCAIRVEGDSMRPRYNNGDLLAIKILNSPSFFQWGKVYVLDTTQGCIIKRLFPDPKDDTKILCHSENSDNYPDYSIPKEDVSGVAIVVGHAGIE